jgi:hypothetical protein
MQLGKNMSTRSTIWLGESAGKFVHIYWELPERDKVRERSVAPIYIAFDSGDANNEVALRLPKDIALGLLTILSPDAAAEVCQVV